MPVTGSFLGSSLGMLTCSRILPDNLSLYHLASHPPGTEVSAGLSSLPRVLRVLAEVGHVVARVCRLLSLLQRPLNWAATQHLLLQLLQFTLDVLVTQPVTIYVKISSFMVNANSFINTS